MIPRDGREALIQNGLSRRYSNESMARVKRMFKWSVAEELLPQSVYQALVAVAGLRRGRSAAKETDRILPVAEAVVEAHVPCLPAVVAYMVRLQRLSNMRPAEVCLHRPGNYSARSCAGSKIS